MMFNLTLSNKILIYFFTTSIIIIFSTYFVLQKITEIAFYETELEKAKIIAKTVTPLIGLDIFLGLDNNLDEILKELSNNENIISVKIFNNNKIIKEFNKNVEHKKDSFLIKQDIFQPNSNKKIGEIEIEYSSRHYKRLIRKYQKALFIFLIILLISIFLFSYYLNKLIKPLKIIAKDLENYNPKKLHKFIYTQRKDEIGLISKALNSMQTKIIDYSKRVENMNSILEKKVEKKTKELKEQLYIDSLTRLPNRFSLVDDMKNSKYGSLILINIDDFKEVNDFFGYKTGDKILIGFANRLKNVLKRDFPKIYRLSGDEFALFFDKKMTKADLEHFIEILIKKIENMIFLYNDNELNVRVTMGVSLGPNSLLERADIALKYAKKRRVSYKFYEKELNIEKQYIKNIEWVKKIKKAIKNDKIVPFFQPIFRSDTFDKVGYEALMRLIDEDGNIVTPINLLKISKRSRYYADLTKIMFEKSSKHFSKIDYYFSFNLSIEDILNQDTIDFIKDKIDRYNIHSKVNFEIVESEGIENFKEVLDFIIDMKKIGAKISIDDFGSGYSNFEYLAKLPIDFIKIDGSLIKNIDKDENTRIVVEVIVDYAKKKGIKTVAEFVSSKDIYHVVKDIGVDLVQGFYIGKPTQNIDIKAL